MAGGGQNIAVATKVLGVVEAFLVTAAILMGISYATGQAPLHAASGMFIPPFIALAVLIVVQLAGNQSLLSLVDFRISFRRIVVDAGIGFVLAVIATGQMAKHEIVQIYPYRWEWTFALTAVWLLCVLTRRHVLGTLADRGLLARRIVAVTDRAGRRRLEELQRRAGKRFVVAAQVDDDDVAPADLVALAKQVGAPEIVVCAADANLSDLVVPRKMSVVDFDAFFERETGRVCLSDDALRDLRAPQRHPYLHFAKRAFDVVVALTGIVASAPVMVLAAIAIRIEDGAPSLFRQTRVGLNGREFTLYKFRSMRVDAEEGLPVWAAENDPRITRVGSIIRRFRVDELPQFYNVLRGDMSFVGPRPERPYFVHQLADSIPMYTARHQVKPGITGWAQVSFRYGASFEDACEKTAFDLYYVRHQSILLDLIILACTVKVIFWPHGVR